MKLDGFLKVACGKSCIIHCSRETIYSLLKEICSIMDKEGDNNRKNADWISGCVRINHIYVGVGVWGLDRHMEHRYISGH